MKGRVDAAAGRLYDYRQSARADRFEEFFEARRRVERYLPSAHIHSGQFGSQIGLLPRTTANCMEMSGSGDLCFFAASTSDEAKKQASINSAGINQTRDFTDLTRPLRCNDFAFAQLY